MARQMAERIAVALEQIVERLSALEMKIEELSLEVQAQGSSICEAISPMVEECEN